MDEAAQLFIQKLERTGKSARKNMVTGSTRGRLRRMVNDSRHQLQSVVETFQVILQQMCCITYDDYQTSAQTPGWDYRWKPTSRLGCDVRRRDRIVDYGNMEYATILQLLYLQDSCCRERIDFISEYWHSIHPLKRPLSDHCVEMQGDVIEVCLAALRGHPYFNMGACLAENTFLPDLYQQVLHLCRFVQFIDAAVGRGYVKATS